MLSNIVKHSYRAVDSTEFTAFSISKGMFMNLLKYKGKHIRVSDKSLVFRFSAGSLFLLFLAVIMLLNLKSILTTDWKSVSFLQDGNVHIFDEYVAFMEMLTTKENAAVLNKLKQIVMLGRQAGYFLILAC